MKRSVLIKFGCLAGLVAGTVAQGQVFNVHEIQHGYAFYGGYNVMAFGQGAASDPGNNIWNGFGNGAGSGPGSTASFGGGRTNDLLLLNNPGNPYANSHNGFVARGPNLFSPVNESAPNCGNVTSAGAHSPITVPSMIYGGESDAVTAFNTLLGTDGTTPPTPAWVRTNVAELIFSSAAIVNSGSPGAGTAANPLGTMILSNVPAGTYDVFLYGANYDGTRGATFGVDSGTPTNGIYVTENEYAVAGSGPETNFVLGVDFVVFNNVTPNADSTIHISWGTVSNVNSGFAGEGDFNGLQLVPAAPVQAGPVIIGQPVNAVNSQGTTASLSVVARGNPAVAYQWYSGSPPGTLLSGQTNSSLVFSNALSTLTGDYFVVVTNIVGAVTSSVVNLTVAAAPVVTAQSTTALTLYSGHNHFGNTVTAIGGIPYPLYFYWKSNGVTTAISTNPTPSGTESTAYFNTTASANYTCVVSNFYGSTTSSPLVVTIIAAPASTPYNTALFALNPFAYWQLNESSGTTAFDYVGGNNGAIIGSPTMGAPGPSTGFGASSLAYSFPGTATTYIDVPGGPLNIVGPMTEITWVQAGLDPNFATVAGKGDTSYRIDIDGSGLAHFNDNNGNEASGGPFMQNEAWHQIVGTFDGAQIVLYVDGVAVASGTDHSTNGDALDFIIGGAPDYINSNPTRDIPASIAQVALFTNALTALQVSNLFQMAETPPVISSEPASYPNGYPGGNATFTVAASGYLPLSYQWSVIVPFTSTNTIAGATNTTLLLTDLNLGENGNYYFCTITNAYGSTNTPQNGVSGILTVTPSGPEFVVDLPSLAYGILGEEIILFTQEGGDEPITNQWVYGASSPPTTALHNGDRGGRVSGATNTTLLIASVVPGDAGYYQLLATNDISPGSSVICQLLMELEPSFNTNGAGWTANGSASINNSVLTLTPDTSGEVGSFFFDTPVYIGAFAVSFTYQESNAPAATPADGITFCLQNSAAGRAAIGGGGGELGYAGITNSAAVAFDLYNAPPGGVQYLTDGAAANALDLYTLTTPIALTSGDPVNINMVYNGSTIALNMKDTTTLGTFATNIIVGSLSSAVGGETALIGFTGATGGDEAQQTVSNFSYTRLTTLSATLSGTNLVISWPTGGLGGVFTLQESASLSAPSWTSLSGPYAVVGSNYQVVVPARPAANFFRLEYVP